MANKRNDLFVPVPEGFTVSTPRNNLAGPKFEWEPSGLYITFDFHSAYVNYAGEKAGESGIQFEIPSSPEFLRTFAKKLVQKAAELEK